MIADREKGAALLAVLLLVAVMAALAAVSMERLLLATRLAGNIAATDQARAFVSGAESLAILRIDDLAARDDSRTTLAEDWMGTENILPLPDGGVATATVWDGANCFNLNSVVEGDGGTYTVRYPGVQQFTALMVSLDIPQGDAERIAEALGDWIDTDQRSIAGAQEDIPYQQSETPYRAANALVATPSELRAIDGMTAEYYAAVRPWVCALPEAGATPINVNTLLEREAPLLAMLAPGQLTVDQAAQAIRQRPEGGWGDVTSFWASPAVAAIEVPPEAYQQVDVRTVWFRLDLSIAYGGVDLQQSSTVDARFRPARVVAREWGRTE